MSTQFDKPQFSQIEESAPSPTPAFFGMAMEAQIADSDFRTYVLLCQTALQEHPAAASPWTERTYAELAALHPEHRPVSAETVRGRLNRLNRAGLITRERSGQSTWRTYPVLDGPLIPGLSATRPSPVAAQSAPQSPIHLTLHLTLDPENREVQVTEEQVAGAGLSLSKGGRWQAAEWAERALGAHPQPQVTERSDRTPRTHPDRSDRARGTHREIQGVGGQGTEQAGRVALTHPEPSGRAHATHPDAQSVGTQRVESAGRARGTHPDRSDCVQGIHPEQPGPAESAAAGAGTPLGVRGEHTQTTLTPSECAPGTHPDTPHTRVCARVSTDFSTDLSTDSLSVNSTQKRESDQSVLSTALKEGQEPIKKAGVGEKHSQTHTSPAKGEETTQPVPSPAQSQKDAPAAPQVENDAPTPASPDTGNTQSGGKAGSTPYHPVLDHLNVLPVHADLAVTLATLPPQGMNYEGIKECLQQPRLTQAWLDYTLAQGDAIRSPAAYIRQGVRSMRRPVSVTRAAAPTTPTRKGGWDPNAFGWDDPTIPESLYKKYTFDNGRLAAARRAALEAGEMSH